MIQHVQAEIKYSTGWPPAQLLIEIEPEQSLHRLLYVPEHTILSRGVRPISLNLKGKLYTYSCFCTVLLIKAYPGHHEQQDQTWNQATDTFTSCEERVQVQKTTHQS